MPNTPKNSFQNVCFSALSLFARPIAGKLDRVLADFVPGDGHIVLRVLLRRRQRGTVNQLFADHWENRRQRRGLHHHNLQEW